MTKATFKTVQEAQGKQPKIERLENVHFMYVKLQKPDTKYQSKDKEWSLNMAVTEDTADEFAEKFPKASVKKIKTADFEAKYKFAPPYPEEKNQYILKMAVRAEFKDKETGELVEIPYTFNTRPKVYEVVGGKAVDITMDKQVGNGSKGHVQYAVTENQFGVFCYMRAVLITDLVERESTGGGSYNPFEDMGLSLVEAEAPVEQPELVKQQTAVQEPSFSDDDFDDMVPF